MNNTITKYQNGLGIDNKLKLKTNGVSKYFLQDHLGSTTALTNSSGSVVESASYDSFGNSTNNLTTRYQFTGREFDSDIGLQYSRARWYSSELGRFISEDPIGLNGGINQFGYVGNNSINVKDPSGLFPFFIGIHGLMPITPPDRNLDCVDEECRKDIEDMVGDMETVRDQMNSDGRRISDASGTWENIRASGNLAVNLAASPFGYQPVDPLEGCIGQSAAVLERLAGKKPKDPQKGYNYERGYDLPLGMKDVGNFPITSHKWVKAIPKNPKCPKVRLDVWNNNNNWELIK